MCKQYDLSYSVLSGSPVYMYTYRMNWYGKDAIACKFPLYMYIGGTGRYMYLYI